MKPKIYFLLLATAAWSAGCQSQGNKTDKTVYVAHLSALNSNVTGSNTTGEARFVVENDTMTVTIDVKGATPNTEHWQHFHGFPNGDAAGCPTDAADANGDGIIDVVETEPVSGTTMVPFNELPAAMEVGSDTYPRAGADGSYHYEAKIPMNKLEEAFAAAFPDSKIELDHRVLYVHGVPADQTLPGSVASIGDIPAQVTIPVACGKIEKVNE